MGEWADMILDNIDWDTDYLEPEPFKVRAPKHPTCRFCGKKNLRWRQIGKKWVLFEKKAPHNCPKRPLSLETLKKVAGEVVAAQRKKK